MIAVTVRADVVLAGVAVPAHRMLEVVDDPAGADDVATTITHGQARALVSAGYAEPVQPDFDELPALLEGWQRTQ